MNRTLLNVLADIPQQEARRDGAFEQLRRLWGFANRLGLYDAADFIRVQFERLDKTERRPGTARPAMAVLTHLDDVLRAMPKLSQRQDATNAQLADLTEFAGKLGLCDAVDFLREVLDKARA